MVVVVAARGLVRKKRNGRWTQSWNYQPYRSLQFHLRTPLSPPIPDWDIIFSKTRNSDKYGNYTSSLFQAPIASRSRSFLRRLASPRPSSSCHPLPSAVLIVFEGMEKHRPRERNTLIYRCTAIHPRSDYNEGN